MQMPKVTACSVTECSYNKDNKCHALAIQVGDPEMGGMTHPACDTFIKMSQKGGDSQTVAGIGACKAFDCNFNKLLECSAPGINVGHHEQHADCETFERRK